MAANWQAQSPGFFVQQGLRCASADRNQGNPLAVIIAGDSHRLGVEGQLPIHNVGVAMMAVFQIHAERPVAVPAPLHGVRGPVPTVEIANDADVPGLRGDAHKIAGGNIMRAVLTSGYAHVVK